MKHKNKFRNIT